MVLQAVQENTNNLRGIHKFLGDSRNPFRTSKTTDTHNSINDFFFQHMIDLIFLPWQIF